MIDKNFDPWKRVREFNPEALLQEIGRAHV